MSTLLEQMQMDLELSNYSPKTIESYLYHINAFLKYFQQAPEVLDEDDIRKYLYYCKTEKKMSSSNLAQAFSAVKFLYRSTLKMPMTLTKLRGPGRVQRLPIVLSKQELRRLFDAAGNPKHKAMLMTIYGAGLRISEAANLKIADIDSDRMQMRVEQGKGRKDRYTLLSTVLLQQLREYWRLYRPKTWLFPARDEERPISTATILKVFHRAKKKPGS